MQRLGRTARRRITWNGCVTDRDQSYDTLNTDADRGTLYPIYAEQYNACPAPLMPLSYDFAALKTKVDSATPNGGTKQPIGIAWGWQSPHLELAAQCASRGRELLQRRC